MPHYAHSLEGRPLKEWQPLEDHLKQVADLAECFSSAYAPGWGRLAGLWHDAGKYRREFQKRIGAGDADAHISTAVDHKSTGVLLAHRVGAPLLGFAILGHHGGIPNRDGLEEVVAHRGHLLIEAMRDGLPRPLASEPRPPYPEFLKSGSAASLSLWIRFVFSALVDADFLDTEAFYEKGAARAARRPSILELRSTLDNYIDAKCREVEPSPVNSLRGDVLAACRRAANDPPGLYTLTVPTGGGKTLSSLSFALGHAERHNKARVIVVIPYTSIIEQTAAVYREALGTLGTAAVVEHHTNADPNRETAANRLAWRTGTLRSSSPRASSFSKVCSRTSRPVAASFITSQIAWLSWMKCKHFRRNYWPRFGMSSLNSLRTMESRRFYARQPSLSCSNARGRSFRMSLDNSTSCPAGVRSLCRNPKTLSRGKISPGKCTTAHRY